jgi:transmembrane protein EpsG
MEWIQVFNMTILWMNLAAVFSISLLARYFAVPSFAGPVQISPNKLLALAAAASLIAVSGLRSNIGDTFFYMHAYVLNDFGLDQIEGQKDFGFYFLQMLLKTISEDPQILVFVTGLITNALIVAVLYNYSRLFELSLFVYITSGAFIISMNGMRQFLAAAIAFAATTYILKGDWKKYMLVIIFASIFHQSVLILLPVYFIVRQKAWTRTTGILILLSISIVAAFNQFSEVLFASIQDTQYGHYESFSEGGANVLRVIVSGAPLLIAYFGRKRLREIFPNSDVIVNLSLMSVIMMIIATQNWIFARIAIYFDLYQLILIGWIVKVFREKDQKLVYISMLVLYFVFFFYESVITLGLKYESTYLNW